MARRKVNKSKKNKEKITTKVQKKTKKVGRPKLLKTKLKEMFKTKEDIIEFGKKYQDDWPSIWCDRNEHFINMLACLHRKYVFRYHSSCSRCKQVFEELEKILGDRVKEI